MYRTKQIIDVTPELAFVMNWPAWMVSRWGLLREHTEAVFFSGTLWNTYNVTEDIDVLVSYIRVLAIVYDLLGAHRVTIALV